MATRLVHGTDGQDNFWTSIGENFAFSEDEALKTYLKGMLVSDEKNAIRPVGVWFALPDMEVRDQSFPFLVIELISIVEAKDREMRGLLKLTNDPQASEPYSSGFVRWATTPLPFNLIYQVTAFTRHPRHNRQIIAQMLSKKIPGRLFALPVASDCSKRSMELLSWVSRDTVEGGRKLWQTVYTISIAAEISDIYSTEAIPRAETPVLTVNVIEEDI